MITNQLMKREFFNSHITQRTKDSYFNATELLSIYNTGDSSIKRFKDFWENKNTNEFLKELENDIISNGQNSPYLKTYETTRGNGGATWMHPYLFVKFAMWLSPKFELQIIKWVYDNLIDFRTQAGDNYKEMCIAIQENYFSTRGEKPDAFIYINEANYLNLLTYGSMKPKMRNELNEIELSLLNNLQKLNIKLIQKLDVNKDSRKKILMEYAYNYKLINS